MTGTINTLHILRIVLDILRCNKEVTNAEHMALLKYFKLNKHSLPDPEGPLSAHVSSDCIIEASKEVSVALKVKRAPYIKATQDQKAVMGKYAAAHGVVNTIKRYQKDFSGNVLKESTVRGWRDAYNKVVDEGVKEAEKRAALDVLWMCKLCQKRNAVVR